MSSRPSPSSELADRFPGLAHLAGAYLGQMYEYVDGSPEEAVRSFCAAEPSQVASAAEGIAFLLSEYPTESDRLTALRPIHWAYAPEDGALDAFLVWARDLLSQSSAHEIATG